MNYTSISPSHWYQQQTHNINKHILPLLRDHVNGLWTLPTFVPPFVDVVDLGRRPER
jgi:hypothetical protein